jgi:hypothetical protein
MEFKGTKEKWLIQDKEKNYFGVVYTSIATKKEGVFIDVYSKEHEANALLISKAPEMLEMLKEFEIDIRQGYVINKNRLNKIQQLIKEATEI